VDNIYLMTVDVTVHGAKIYNPLQGSHRM